MYMYDVMLSAKQLASMLKVHCAVPEKIHTYPVEGHNLEILRGRGVLKVKTLEAKYEAKQEFPGARG